MAKEFVKLIEQNEYLQEYFAQAGGGDFNKIFFSTLLGITAVFATGFAVQAMTKMRNEESSDRLESLLGTSVSRQEWIVSHLFLAVVGTIVIVALTGLSASATNMLISNVSFADSIELVQGSIVQIPAIILFSSIIALTFARLPHQTIAVGWGAFTFSLLIEQLAVVLKLPSWVVNLSPFSHTPLAPATSVDFKPLIIMTATGIVIILFSLLLFRNRDLTIS